MPRCPPSRQMFRHQFFPWSSRFDNSLATVMSGRPRYPGQQAQVSTTSRECQRESMSSAPWTAPVTGPGGRSGRRPDKRVFAAPLAPCGYSLASAASPQCTGSRTTTASVRYWIRTNRPSDTSSVSGHIPDARIDLHIEQDRYPPSSSPGPADYGACRQTDPRLVDQQPQGEDGEQDGGATVDVQARPHGALGDRPGVQQ